MAETAVRLLLQNLSPLLIQEATLFKDVHNEFESIKDELEIIQSFLQDADARAEVGEPSNVAKTWVNQVRETAFRIEDAIDEYMLQLAQGSHEKGQFLNYLQNAFHFTLNLKNRHEIASKIRNLKTRLRDIKERGEKYGFKHQAGGTTSVTWHDPRVRALFLEEDQLVGIESSREELIGLLTEGPMQRTVISVVAMGGAGKTTLAKKVFEHQKVVSCFDCRAWITVSQSFKLEVLLKLMIKQFRKSRRALTLPGVDNMGEVELIGAIRDYLHEKRYVIVFDDVWKINFWEDIEHALPDKQMGSRIVITTRSEVVAPSIRQSSSYHVYKLQLLPPEKAWELFCLKAFQAESGKCPSELLELSGDIVGRCGGLPLAIVTIGALLARKDRVVSEWRKVHDNLGSMLASTPQLEPLKIIMSLSYHDLPYNLKSCFLYFGIFPEDYLIKCARLRRLWVAEGFLEERQGVEPEEVAEEYLTELIHRSLVQVARVGTNGKARQCRIHDLLHDFILSKSEEIGLCQMPVRNLTSLNNGNARHLSINNRLNSVSGSINNSQTRSIVGFVYEKEELPLSLVSTMFDNFKLLKALDFQDAPLVCIPTNLGNLLLLRHLSIKNTNVSMLPKSIGNLCNLETLDLRGTPVYELPVEIYRLTKLRHLLAYYYDREGDYNFSTIRGIKMDDKIGSLKCLQKLDKVEGEPGFISELGKLQQMRKLGISKLKGENTVALLTALEKMTQLQNLLVSMIDTEEVLELQSLSFSPLRLQNLSIAGKLRELPVWISKLENLVRLRLYCSGLKDDPLQALQGLTNLVRFTLYDGYDGEELHFKEGCFPKLNLLRLESLNGLKKVIIDKGTLPLLQTLRIGPSPQMEFPPGIQYLTNLNTLEIFNMPREFVLSLQPDDGPDYCRVKHIPKVLFNYWTTGAQKYKAYKLGDLELLEHLRS